MKRPGDPLVVSPHWHVDCRIEAELPEDRLVTKRFLVNAFASAAAFSALLFTGYLGYQMVHLRQLIESWDQRMKESRPEVREIQRMQGEYAAEAAKIDQAHALVRPEFHVFDFISHIGRTRPEQMTIDMIEWNDTGVVVRGNVRERSERASRVLGGYVEQLRVDEKVKPLFQVDLTDIDRGAATDVLKFEIMFRLAVKKR